MATPRHGFNFGEPLNAHTFIGMAEASRLHIEFAGRLITLESHSSIRFGRAGRLVIDPDNQNLHRELGELIFSDGLWWLRNIGRSIPMRLWTADRTTRSIVMSGSELALPQIETVIEFEAGRSRYELRVEVDAKRTPPPPALNHADASLTISPTDVPLTTTQRQLIVSLAEHALRNPGAAVTVPPSKEAAARLGWPMTKFNAKLKNVCKKFSGLGVQGLGADNASATMDRRLRLVQFCVFNKVVTVHDLEVLDANETV